MSIVFTTKNDNINVVAKVKEISELFASSFNSKKFDKNKAKCFLDFTIDNQKKWCEDNFTREKIKLLKNPIFIGAKYAA